MAKKVGNTYFFTGKGKSSGGGGGGSEDAVLYTPQTLSSSEQAQARTNIGAGTYSKPSGGIPTSDLQVGVDATPTASSTNLVESGGVYSFVGDPIVSLTVPTPNDGTVIFAHRSGDTTTLDLNHVHLQYYGKAAGSSMPVGGFAPDEVYALGTISGTVTFSLAAAVSGNVNHYFWTFETGGSAPDVNWPAGLTWEDGSAPTPGANKHCEVSILGGVATYLEV